MENKRDLVAAALLVLSRIRKMKGQDTSLDLPELDRSLGILADLSDPEERDRLLQIRGDLDSLERERLEFMQEYDARLRERSGILERTVSDLLARRIPEEQRAEIMGRLEEMMVGDGGDEISVDLGARTAGMSRLERKLQLVEADIKSSGLEKFLRKDKANAGN